MTDPFHPSAPALELALLDAPAPAGSASADLATAAAATLLQRRDGRSRTLPGQVRGTPDVVKAALEALAALTEADDGERRTALVAADQACAAAHALGVSQRVLGAVDRVAGLIRAMPEDWEALSEDADDLLAHAPPLPGEPARALWQAVATAGWEDASTAEDDAQRTRLTVAEMMALGLDAQLPWTHLVGERMAAADALPTPGPWERLLRGDGWELALTVGPTGQPVALLTGADLPPFAAERDGLPVEVSDDPEGKVVTLQPGRWAFSVGGETCHILLGD